MTVDVVVRYCCESWDGGGEMGGGGLGWWCTAGTASSHL